MSDENTTPAGAQAPETEQSQRRSRGPAINRVMLLGRLTADPELYYSQEGNALARLRLATNEREEPEYHQLTAFGKQAEFVAEYLGTGRLVYVEGRLQTQSFFDKATGEKRYTTKVLVNSIQALDRPRQEGPAPEPGQERQAAEQREAPTAATAEATAEGPRRGASRPRAIPREQAAPAMEP